VPRGGVCDVYVACACIVCILLSHSLMIEERRKNVLEKSFSSAPIVICGQLRAEEREWEGERSSSSLLQLEVNFDTCEWLTILIRES